MKMRVLLVLCMIFVAQLVNAELVACGGKTPIESSVDGVPVKIHFGGNTHYANSGYCVKTFHLVIEAAERLAIKNKYFKGQTGTIEIKYSSSDEKVLYVDDDGAVSLLSPGKASLIVACGNKSFQIPFLFQQVPVAEGATQDEIIKSLGLPDSQEKIFVDWAKHDMLDNIYYAPQAQDVKGMSVEHWKYNKFPDAIFRFITSERLKDIANADTERLPVIRAKLEYAR